MPKPRRISIAFSFTMLLTAGPAPAFDVNSTGATFGVSASPDQFHGGLFAELSELIGGVRIRPSAELGFGNGVAIVSANTDALVTLARGRWQPYAGGGIGLNVIDVRNGVGEGRGIDLAPVLNLIGGVEWGRGRASSSNRYLAEARIGLGDTPDLRVSFGIRF